MQSKTAEALFEAAQALQREGRLDEARARFKELEALLPGHPEPTFRLGALSAAEGRHEEARRLFEAALGRSPRDPRYLTALGRTLIALGLDEEAEARFEQALGVDDSVAAARLGLGRAQAKLGRPEAAIASFRAVLNEHPRSKATLVNLGGVLVSLGRLSEASQCFKGALAIDPGLAAAHSNLAAIQQMAGDRGGALRGYREALRIDPGLASAALNLAKLELSGGQREEAATILEAARQHSPRHPELLLELGMCRRGQGRYRDAVDCFKNLVELQPDDPVARHNFGAALQTLGAFSAAIPQQEKAVQLDPQMVLGWCNLAQSYAALQRPEDALVALERAAELEPDRLEVLIKAIFLRARCCDWSRRENDEAALDDLLQRLVAGDPGGFLLASRDLCGFPSVSAQVHRLVAEHHAAGIAASVGEPLPPVEKPPSRPRRLRIGYLSPDLRRHAVGICLRDVFSHHDRDRFEIHAYSLVDLRDDLTHEISESCDHFEEVAFEASGAIAKRIRDDGIDCLVDLAGPTTFAKPEILAFRPAALQILYLGYPDTSGAGFVDYLVADAQLIPEQLEPSYSEAILHLPTHFLASGWPQIEADLGRAESGLPESGPVLGCFNSHYKIEPTVFDSWMRILHRLPDAVLWLGEEPGPTAVNLKRQAEQRGVDPKRLIFSPRVPLEEFIARLSLCDLFLDTFSYSAGATGVCCLLAGTPLLTRPGETFASRMGASLCAAAGIPELICASSTDYEDLAVELASDRGRLDELRHRLGAAKRSQPLFDASGFTASLEKAYDLIWSRWHSG